VPDTEQLKAMIIDILAKHRDEVPAFPGSAYIRPTLIGTDQSIGAQQHQPAQRCCTY
jgi:branched-chain amino acid aminotransferase